MAKFTFPIPGRSKKQTPPVPPSEPLTKAQRVLGATQFATDSTSPRAWDSLSTPGISVSLSDGTAHSSGRGESAKQRADRDWGDESDIVPNRLRPNDPLDESDDLYSEYTRELREQHSSSTIRSWYDKAKLPLAVSQQTSSSAIAKGPPCKAQRLLDIDNAYSASVSKSKKKPAKLDLSQVKPSSRGKDNDWDGPVLGNDFVTRSPSILSPLSPTDGSKRQRRRIQKHRTLESLRSAPRPDDQARPVTSGNRSPAQHEACTGKLDGLPGLYRHYEQMSFAQIMDAEEEPVKETLEPKRDMDRLPNLYEDAAVPFHDQIQPLRQREEETPGPLSSHPTLTSLSSHSSYSTQRSHSTFQLGHITPLTHPPHSVAPPPAIYEPIPIKIDAQSPTDYAASISSRHTRTSKASRRTDKSFQTSDLQEKSILMLSSDSEEDDEADRCTDSPGNSAALTAPATRRPSPVEKTRDGVSLVATSSIDSPPRMADDAQSLQSRESTLPFKRMSSAPAGFLTMPSRFSSQTTSPASSRLNIRDGSQAGQSSRLPVSPSNLSLSTTNSSVSTTMTWQGKEGYGIQEARAVTMVTAQGRQLESAPGTDNDSDLEYDEPELVVRHESAIPPPVNTAEPTPPISPTTMDRYIHAPESMEGAHEHFMGLTRQEQMLIQALRQKREVMRRNSPPRSDEDVSELQKQPPRRGHQTNPSEATITEETFNFGFPAPPKNTRMASRDSRQTFSSSSSMIELPLPGDEGDDSKMSRSASRTVDDSGHLLSPPPSSQQSSRDLSRNTSVRENSSRETRRSHVPPHTDHGVSPAPGVSEKLTRSNTLGYVKRSSSRASSRDALGNVRSHSSSRRQRSTLESKFARDRSTGRDLQYPIMEEEPTLLPAPRHQPKRPEADYDHGVPRPDSPISPLTGAFPAVPTKKHNKQGARLSAFGPPQADFGEWSWAGKSTHSDDGSHRE
ncbi:hypothetical protein ACRE_080860 [Hapsidospora chrysogenum ATCC 11550]|uniref:Uncharacterized protein n=1 Tax=Hapsidospora chrysogenum (strain ATCC 11550 / CBS 779.69 / DSM 880 / IAM 14645 / JCM 23072 / IMI 49137) TaxID=857340 RepID=A0A086SVR8_HAPC1|nr:hypothetical protein ACRE_080860 [Hapsidospora chrysogenum ATCC 11550]